MRILVASKKTNGVVPGDYDHCVAGEIVYMQEPCATDARAPDGGGCGCGRGFAGTNSHRATTTAEVVDSDLSEEEVREAVRSSLEAGGWLDSSIISQELCTEIIDEAMTHMTRVAEHFPVGSVVRRRLSTYYVGDTAP